VFTPSILTILGVIMYLRFGWVVGNVGLPATLLIRAATLWFAVLLGLTVTLLGRRRLHWSEVREEAATAD
jgi:hypothetical protein